MLQPVSAVRCPTCNTASTWSVDNPYRPFCSERCKMADLGSWLNGDYRLPLDEPPPEPSPAEDG